MHSRHYNTYLLAKLLSDASAAARAFKLCVRTVNECHAGLNVTDVSVEDARNSKLAEIIKEHCFVFALGSVTKEHDSAYNHSLSIIKTILFLNMAESLYDMLRCHLKDVEVPDESVICVSAGKSFGSIKTCSEYLVDDVKAAADQSA